MEKDTQQVFNKQTLLELKRQYKLEIKQKEAAIRRIKSRIELVNDQLKKLKNGD